MTDCHTFTHHVGGGIRVECDRHPSFVVDVPKQDNGADKSTRQLATEVQREHEAQA